MTNEEKIDYLQGEVLFLDLISKILLAQPKIELLQALVNGDVFSEVPFAEAQSETIEAGNLLQRFTKDFAGAKCVETEAGEPDVVGSEADGSEASEPQASMPGLRRSEADINSASVSGHAFSEQIYGTINNDYMNMLVGLGAPLAPPWETSYLGKQDKLLFQAETLEVRAWYKRFGLELQNKYHEPDDTITYELEFAGHLAERAANALEQNEIAEYRSFLEAQRDFSDKHLLQWVYSFCEALYTNAKSDYYKGLGKLLAGGMKELTGSWKTLLGE